MTLKIQKYQLLSEYNSISDNSMFNVTHRDFGEYFWPEREYLNRVVFFKSLPGGFVGAIGR